MSATDKELLALAAKWRERSRTFMCEARESDSQLDTYRLSGMASSLKFAADDLCFTARLNPNDVPPVVNAEADYASLAADNKLGRDSKEPQP